jgi:large subunit ribosomal protein L24
MPKLKRAVPLEPVKLKIKKGDTVEVIAGKDKGKRGEIVAAFPKLNKVTVKGANILIRHQKDRPNRSAGATGQNQVIKGGRIEEESPLYAAKVMLVCPNCSRPTRVGYAFKEGEEKLSRRKYRVCKHPDCAKAIDAI